MNIAPATLGAEHSIFWGKFWPWKIEKCCSWNLRKYSGLDDENIILYIYSVLNSIFWLLQFHHHRFISTQSHTCSIHVGASHLWPSYWYTVSWCVLGRAHDLGHWRIYVCCHPCRKFSCSWSLSAIQCGGNNHAVTPSVEHAQVYQWFYARATF